MISGHDAKAVRHEWLCMRQTAKGETFMARWGYPPRAVDLEGYTKRLIAQRWRPSTHILRTDPRL